MEGLWKIIDLTRKISIVILLLHLYITCYSAFRAWQLTHAVTDKVLLNIARTGLFHNIWMAKIAAIVLLAISLVGEKGKKDEQLNWASPVRQMVIGLPLYFLSGLLLHISASIEVMAILYILATVLGYMMVLASGTRLSRLLQLNFKGDIFNKLNETFPQEERLLINEYSVNLQDS